MMNAVVGTSYTAEDEDILGANEDYTAFEDELRQKVANIESTHVRLENKTLPVVVNSRLDAEQKEIYDITLELKGNNCTIISM